MCVLFFGTKNLWVHSNFLFIFYIDFFPSNSFYSGFILPKNIEEYSSNLNKFKTKGKGRLFQYSFAQSEAYIKNPAVCNWMDWTYFFFQNSVEFQNFRAYVAPQNGKVLVKIERDDNSGPVLVSEDLSASTQNATDERLVEELVSLRAKYNEAFFELQKLKDTLKASETESVTLRADNKMLSEQNSDLTKKIVSIQQNLNKIQCFWMLCCYR